MAYVPPLAVIKKALRLNPELAPGKRTLVKSELLRLLLEMAVAAVPFDQDFYLETNPDLRAAVANGTIADLHQHFIAHGWFEGRRGAQPAVDEAWYAQTNPDVADAVAARRLASATQHYTEVGEGEMRAPNPHLAEEVRRWAAALAEA